jgi:hypothetical protein
MTLSTRYLVEAGRTSPLSRFRRMRINPSPMRFFRGQMISRKACFRLAPETLLDCFLDMGRGAGGSGEEAGSPGESPGKRHNPQ